MARGRGGGKARACVGFSWVGGMGWGGLGWGRVGLGRVDRCSSKGKGWGGAEQAGVG